MRPPALLAAPNIHIPNPFSHLNPIPAILSAIGHVFTSGAQSVASWAFTEMTQALVATTQVDLSELCAKGEFRQDLYHRLNVLSLHIPPLRECLDGLTPLVEHFLDQASRQIGCPLPQLAPQAMDRLGRYHWPGNVRQLENVLFQAVSLCEGGTIKVEHIRLPDYGAPHPLGDFSLEGGLDAIVGRFERAVLERLYREHPSSRLLGKRLGVSHTTIANKLRQHGLGQGGES